MHEQIASEPSVRSMLILLDNAVFFSVMTILCRRCLLHFSSMPNTSLDVLERVFKHRQSFVSLLSVESKILFERYSDDLTGTIFKLYPVA